MPRQHWMAFGHLWIKAALIVSVALWLSARFSEQITAHVDIRLFERAVGLLETFAIIYCLAAVVRWLYGYLAIDPNNVCWRDGLRESRIPLWTIRDAYIERPITGTLFNYGTVVIDTGLLQQRIHFVANPTQFLSELLPAWSS